MLTDETGRLCGFFTDSDLARLFEQRRDDALDRPIHEVMTADPITWLWARAWPMRSNCSAAVRSANCRWVDADGKPVGLLDITDLIGLLPRTRPLRLPRGSPEEADRKITSRFIVSRLAASAKR